MNRESGHSALRRGRVSLPGQIYIVTWTTGRRARLFDDWDLASAACRTLHEQVLARRVDLICWVLMPDHWHGVLQLSAGGTLSACVNRLKSTMAIAVNKARAGTGRIWAPAFHDHALRREQDLLAVARYVVCNPIRAGLVRRIWDYPYWDARFIDARSVASGALF